MQEAGAAMAILKVRKSFVISMLLLYSAALFYCVQNGGPGRLHSNCVALWNHQKWQELTSLADNLTSIGKEDTESIYLGMLASRQLGHADQEERFARALLSRRFLNAPIEMELSRFIQPENTIDHLRLVRTRITMVVVILLLTANLYAGWKRSPSVWGMILPVIGFAVLLL